MKNQKIQFLLYLKENKFTIINSTHDPDSFHDVDNILEIEVVDELRTINNLDNYK